MSDELYDVNKALLEHAQIMTKMQEDIDALSKQLGELTIAFASLRAYVES